MLLSHFPEGKFQSEGRDREDRGPVKNAGHFGGEMFVHYRIRRSGVPDARDRIFGGEGEEIRYIVHVDPRHPLLP
jgi:hypothetical protein